MIKIGRVDNNLDSNKFINLLESNDIIRSGNDITANALYLKESLTFPSYKDFIALVAPHPAQGK